MFAMIVLIILGIQMFLPKKISAPLQPKAALVVLPPKIEARREFLFSPSGDSVQAVESATTVENELYRITFTNRGAMVTRWILKKYKDSDGKPLDLVHSQAAREVGFPLSLYTYDTALTAGINEALYVPSAAGNLVAPASLTFTYSDGGVQVRKTFSFDESYVVHADVEVRRNGAPVRSLISWPGGFGDQDNIDAYTGAQLDFARNAKEQHVAAKKVSGGETLNGPFDWAGSSDTYFAAIFLPDSPATATMVTLRNQLDVTKSIRRGGFRWSSSAIEVTIPGVALGDVSGRTETRIYAGPKAVSVLRNIHATHSAVTLEPLLDFGFFGLIGKYLFLTLQFLHAHVVSNWGWAIVLLTALINLLLLPLRIKTIQSSLKMQRIQPQMEAIKERYKKYKTTDPKRNEMNVEIMKLQKDNGVNMFGGCIPTLIQTPLLIAFFSMLPKVVELRQAHWLWVPDLSSADPYHILPIVFVVSMVLSQLLTPSPGVDRSQQRMMAFVMPAVFGFTTWSYGSGVALYWACSNLIGVIQQLVMNRMNLGR
jgi:YidC/Oxa1 family membrane protein insertase